MFHIPDKTIVWHLNGYMPLPRRWKVELTAHLWAGTALTPRDIRPQNVLLDELFTARISAFGLAKCEDEVILVDWACDCYKDGNLELLVENDEEALGDMKRVKKFVMIAIWCIQEDPSLSPTMKKVTQMLEGAVEVSGPPEPSSLISSI
ncbi:receptor-like protein kinase 1 [Actinidia rufa]|uniref:Receptor-like protein kinase 1 n=1 Tax=Actinidia rufa TaxID=165716 RepID=A0A7J0H5A7_9ERIC|nr:receptor-like protein kinase 1 [Actinidia rufa]